MPTAVITVEPDRQAGIWSGVNMRIESYPAREREPTEDNPTLNVVAFETPTFLINQNPSDPLGVHSQPRTDRARASGFANRVVDIVLATLLLILVLPLMLACALMVALSSPGPLLFRHSRIGANGKEFSCLKFRTMVVDADVAIGAILGGCVQSQKEWLELQKLRRDPRVTPGGRFLRRYCLDELPQLFNVLAGHMSIVGPRPIVADEIRRYGSNFSDYCSVKPGLTGLWQVSGRHALSYEQRVQLDTQYARSKSIRLDLWILLMTLPIVLLGQNE